MPSMIGGFWIERGHGAFDWTDIEEASPVSLFQVRWCLPERYIDAHGRMQVVPFYALPYRLEGKGIRFFSRGWGWFYRDDLPHDFMLTHFARAQITGAVEPVKPDTIIGGCSAQHGDRR